MKQIIALAGFLGLFVSQATVSFAGYFNTTPIIPCETQITNTLYKGQENRDIFILQQMLVNAGYLNAAPNGYFGTQTYYAVRAFQANNGISSTGTVGPATRNAVNERLCDVDLLDNTISTTNYGYNTGYDYTGGITYVGANDPFVQVISPAVTNPVIYATPGNNQPASYNGNVFVGQSNSPVYSVPGVSTPINQVQSTGIINIPSAGYTYGITPQSSSVTVTSPRVNSIYREGDTVSVVWSVSNLTPGTFSILLENNTTSQSKVVGVVGGNSFSFVLTKELLDSVCGGSCNVNQQSSFRIVLTTPTTDIIGTVSTLRAAVAPITIKRQLTINQMTLTPSNTTVASGEAFKLRLNIPSDNYSLGNYTNYSIKVKALCPAISSVVVSVAGTPCGQDFTVPFDPLYFQQEIPVKITNTSLFRQDVTFEALILNASGQVVGNASTKVIVTSAPFTW